VITQVCKEPFLRDGTFALLSLFNVLEGISCAVNLCLPLCSALTDSDQFIPKVQVTLMIIGPRREWRDGAEFVGDTSFSSQILKGGEDLLCLLCPIEVI
jgi:hypothetical protein